MAGTLNKVMLIGHLGDDIKMHYFEVNHHWGDPSLELLTDEDQCTEQVPLELYFITL